MVLANYGVELKNLNFDTMIAAYLVGEKNLSLKALAFNRLGVEISLPGESTGTGKKQMAIAMLEAKQIADNACAIADIMWNLRDSLKDELQRHHFRTNSDSEVIIHLFEEEGYNSVSRLDGMFAFVLYDGKDIFVARDPLGIKPLYQGWKDGCLFFASEFKALDGVVDNIQEFPAGHYYSSSKGLVQYYHLPKIAAWKNNVGEITQTLRKLLSEAVQKRWMSDVPLGCFLSGGVDSSLICAISKKYFKHLDTFSVGLEGASIDLEYARKVADFLGTDHHEYIYTKDEVMEALPDVIYHLESFDPALVRSAIPCYFVSRLAHDYVKVILTGEGADEVFAGYHYIKRLKDVEGLQHETVRILNGLHNMNLQRVDRATMAHSIEGRVPFLDMNFVEYAMSISPNLKLAGKHVLERSEGEIQD